MSGLTPSEHRELSAHLERAQAKVTLAITLVGPPEDIELCQEAEQKIVDAIDSLAKARVALRQAIEKLGGVG